MSNCIFKVLRSGINTTYQDEGRFGLQHLGIPPGGCMDHKSYLFANALVGNKKNYGVSASRNRGLKNSSGKYINFLDSDDILLKKSLKQLKKQINKNEQDYYFIKSMDLRKNTIDHNTINYNINKIWIILEKLLFLCLH